MEQITLIFTKRKWNLGSFLIRWCLPRTRFHSGISSHCLIEDGDYLIEANMLHGCRRVLRDEALQGLTVVATVTYNVEDAEAGLAFAREQAGKKYDFPGALGLVVAPDRNWMEDDAWFCYELGAAALNKAGREDFKEDANHISGNMLLAIKPSKRPSLMAIKPNK